MNARRTRRTAWVSALIVPAMFVAGCGGGADDPDPAPTTPAGGQTSAPAEGGETTAPEAGGESSPVEITLAHSYNETQPQHQCGAAVIKEEAEAAGVGLTIEIFPSSQLGGDADRIASVASGDIDMDIQGASALGAVYAPISVLDAAYAFDGPEHLSAFMASDEAKPFIDGFAEEAGVYTLGAWSAGARQFTANDPIRSPEDLQGQRIRFPGSPQFLMNARALGATATEVAYEELYLALQNGTVDGQENPITNIKAQNLPEVQDYMSMTSHQLNTNLIIMSSMWNDLSAEQQEALSAAVDSAVQRVTECVAEEEQTTIDEWKEAGLIEIIEDVDVDAFREQAVSYLEGEFTGESLEAFQAIRATAP
ncbi:MAG: DctP family TRAP transporter solute-binding subunit [bacterium]|nr:DctP family TRAP transporter solute-binding subunit [bacterium]